MGGNVREESKATPKIATVDRCPGQQEPPVHSPAVATKHTDKDAQQTTPQDECRDSSMPCGLTIIPNPTSSAERDINENIPVATSPEDGDRQVDFDPTDNENDDWSSIVTLSPSVLDYPEENGRTYHKFKEGRYPLPNDLDEQDRLDLQHHLFLLTQDQKLLFCPVDLSRVHRVLDLGTGTGL